MQRVLVAVAPNRDVHVFGGVLGRARAQAVGAEREVVVAALVIVVFAAGVELAKDEFPVKALLGGFSRAGSRGRCPLPEWNHRERR